MRTKPAEAQLREKSSRNYLEQVGGGKLGLVVELARMKPRGVFRYPSLGGAQNRSARGLNHVFTMLEDGALMTGADILDITRDTLFTLLLVAGPLLLVALVVGFGIGLLQALTQIQEATLTFVPKLIAMVFVFILTAPLMGRLLGGLMERLAQRIISG